MANYHVSVIVEKDKNGYFAFSPDLKGCYTQGDTYEEVIENIKDAIRLHIEDRIPQEAGTARSLHHPLLRRRVCVYRRCLFNRRNLGLSCIHLLLDIAGRFGLFVLAAERKAAFGLRSSNRRRMRADK